MRSAVLFTCAAFAVCFVPQFSLADDLKSLQGTWEMKGTLNGKETRVEKTVDDHQETVRTYEGETLLREHVVEFELQTDGDVSIFRWKNGKITAGPAQGQPLADGAFVYRIDGDKWTGVFGLLRSDTGQIHAEVYTRMKSD
jgi:hypothetical protein